MNLPLILPFTPAPTFFVVSDPPENGKRSLTEVKARVPIDGSTCNNSGVARVEEGETPN